jgi:hypothetical protein
MPIAASHQIPDTKEEPLQQVFISTNRPIRHCKPRIHHDFIRLCQYNENIYLDMSHGTKKKAKHHAMPS